ncbi:MAG: sigma-70 family RNA polymerase sigma factor [Candidatus Omnitrophota bacterium]
MKYDDLLTRIYPALRAISRKVKTRYIYCDEDDFLQEALLSIWMKGEKGELDDKTDSYILQGAYFFLKNYVRKTCKTVDINSISINGPGNDEDDDIPLEEKLVLDSYADQTDSVEIYLLLDEAEDLFTEREKDVFYYRLEGFTTREIGGKMGVSHVMIGKITKRIREKCGALREELM